ncbi:hypothetical protein HBI76_239950 [Parastagonospora nodorum]|nr:hypothetical protein HBI76_239950 [Parastagonospora nodorum]
MSTSSTQNTNTTTGGRRAEIKKLIDDMMVDIKPPFCQESKFFPSSCVDNVATPENIMAYILEDSAREWEEKDMEEFVTKIVAEARKIFIAVAKNTWPHGLLYQAVVIRGWTDHEIGAISDQYDVKGGLGDRLVKEMKKIHGVQEILRGNFHQEPVGKLLPIVRHQLVLIPPPRPMGVPCRFEVELHKDYWEEAENGREFVMVLLDARPDDIGDAVAGFYGHYKTRTPYWLLFPKGSSWLEFGKLTVVE